tara:strand:+ start:1096 stop:2583 length:1488 start_codon:yes stop_codon:yes gene_type:complete
MVAQSRTLKLSILADVDQLKKSLKTANDDVEGSSNKLGEFSKKAGLAFAAAAAAAGAYAVKLAVDGVKAAIEDEAAQIRLATALKNATGATNEMIASVEQQILKTSLATGVADDKLRPALSRLALSTGDVTKAQDLLSLALDISQSTGKGLDSVANSLGRAFDGNTASLGKLGIGLSATELKSMSFTEVQTKLSDLFGGAAAANADTYAGKIARLKVGFSEAKETLGAALLPQLEKFVSFLNLQALPSLDLIIAGFTGKKGFSNAIGNSESSAFKLGVEMKNLTKTFGSFFSVFSSDGADSLGGFLGVIQGLVKGITMVLIPFQIALDLIVRSINELIKVINLFPGQDLKPLRTIVALPGDPQFTGPNTGSIPFASGFKPGAGVSGGATGGATGGSGTGSIPSVPRAAVNPGIAAAVAGAAFASVDRAAINTQFFQPSAAANRAAGLQGAAMAGINVTVNGAIDAEGTARTIVKTLNDSYFRGTGGAGALAGLNL